jgi:hypothetical protein
MLKLNIKIPRTMKNKKTVFPEQFQITAAGKTAAKQKKL